MSGVGGTVVHRKYKKNIGPLLSAHHYLYLVITTRLKFNDIVITYWNTYFFLSEYEIKKVKF